MISQCRYGRMIHLLNDSYIGHALRKHGEYSESEVQLWRSFVQPYWVVADIGANIGAHTVALAGMANKVAAFEPLPFLYHILCGNLALNGITNVQAFNCALGRIPGEIIAPYLDYRAAGAFGGVPLGDHQQGRRLPIIRLDDVMPMADFLKIDVEGMELDVLRGAVRLIDACHPVLYVEANPGEKQRPLLEHIAAQGYELFWHHAPHYNPDNWNHYPENDLPDTPAPAVLAIHHEGPGLGVPDLERVHL